MNIIFIFLYYIFIRYVLYLIENRMNVVKVFILIKVLLLIIMFTLIGLPMSLAKRGDITLTVPELLIVTVMLLYNCLVFTNIFSKHARKQ